MKKLFASFILTVAAVIGVSAQSYRGFIELGYGIGYDMQSLRHKFTDGDRSSNIECGNSFSLLTTHGCQIRRNLYVGAGIGVLLSNIEGGLYGDGIKLFKVPVYADVRWDLNLGRKVTPFVDLKLGYQIAASSSEESLDENHDWDGGRTTYLYANNTGGLYCVPAVGIRIKTSNHSGISLGFSYNPTVAINIAEENNDVVNRSYKHNLGILMLNLGFDF